MEWEKNRSNWIKVQSNKSWNILVTPAVWLITLIICILCISIFWCATGVTEKYVMCEKIAIIRVMTNFLPKKKANQWIACEKIVYWTENCLLEIEIRNKTNLMRRQMPIQFVFAYDATWKWNKNNFFARRPTVNKMSLCSRWSELCERQPTKIIIIMVITNARETKNM